MQPSKRSCALNQLNLFRPLSSAPLWIGLPVEVREQVLKLLAKLLRHHREAQLAARELNDE